MLKIYGIPQSRALRCLWMARELGVPHTNIPVHFDKTRESAELSAVNPNGRIPAIDDDGFHLFESMAINLYLAKNTGPEPISFRLRRRTTPARLNGASGSRPKSKSRCLALC